MTGRAPREQAGRGSTPLAARLDPLRAALFALAGATLPLFAFPPFRVAGRPVDLATALAVLFVAASVPALAPRAKSPLLGWLGAAAAVPLLALLPARPRPFSAGQFAASWAHWLLLAAFFASAMTLRVDGRGRRRLQAVLLASAALVAAFALYQVLGIPRSWPATGGVLVPLLQREPFRLWASTSGYVRPTSTFLEPAWLGSYLAWSVAIAATAILSPGDPTRRERLFFASTFLLGLAALAATVSWGAYLDASVALSAAVAATLAARGGALRIVKGAAAAAAVAGLLLASGPGREVASAVKSRARALAATPLTGEVAEGRVADSSRNRAINAADGIRHFLRHPVGGIGLGQFRIHQAEVLGRPEAARDPWAGWTALPAETGVLGPVVLLAALLLALRFRPGTPWRLDAAAVALVSFCAVQPLHMASYLDLAWWYPLSLAAVLAAPRDGPAATGVGVPG